MSELFHDTDADTATDTDTGRDAPACDELLAEAGLDSRAIREVLAGRDAE